MLYRVVDSKNFNIYFIGNTEKECIAYVEKHKLNNVFIESYVPKNIAK